MYEIIMENPNSIHECLGAMDQKTKWTYGQTNRINEHIFSKYALKKNYQNSFQIFNFSLVI
jgi:hypothetical protein